MQLGEILCQVSRAFADLVLGDDDLSARLGYDQGVQVGALHQAVDRFRL